VFLFIQLYVYYIFSSFKISKTTAKFTIKNKSKHRSNRLKGVLSFVVRIKQIFKKRCIGFMVFNATFNKISIISCRSVVLVEETGVPGENHRQTLSHITNKLYKWR
jgi:hypothetical protein